MSAQCPWAKAHPASKIISVLCLAPRSEGCLMFVDFALQQRDHGSCGGDVHHHASRDIPDHSRHWASSRISLKELTQTPGLVDSIGLRLRNRNALEKEMQGDFTLRREATPRSVAIDWSVQVTKLV